MSFRTLATVLLATPWRGFFSAPLDQRVAPRGILGGHPHNQGRDLLHDPEAAWPLRRERPLPGDQLPVPPQDRVGRHEGRDLPQEPSPESSAFGGEASALVVGQPEAAPLHLPLEDPVLLHQVFDDVLLVAVDPTREGSRAAPARGRRRPSWADRTVPHPGPCTDWGSAEYSDPTPSAFLSSGRWCKPGRSTDRARRLSPWEIRHTPRALRIEASGRSSRQPDCSRDRSAWRSRSFP